MKRVVIIIFCILFFKLAYSISPGKSNNALLLNSNHKTEISFKSNQNYQQFKFQVVNFEANNVVDYANLKKRRKKNDNLMLYVAGGLAVATAALILANDPENFTTNSSAGVNVGIAAAGTVACGMIVAKFFIDKRR